MPSTSMGGKTHRSATAGQQWLAVFLSRSSLRISLESPPEAPMPLSLSFDNNSISPAPHIELSRMCAVMGNPWKNPCERAGGRDARDARPDVRTLAGGRGRARAGACALGYARAHMRGRAARVRAASRSRERIRKNRCKYLMEKEL